MNRIIHANREMMQHPTAHVVEKMLEDFKIFESQLNDWYTSLPSSISFPLPIGTIQPLQDELIQLLRARYLCMKELCYRPFVQFATNHPLDLPNELFEELTRLVSQGLQYCAFRLQAVPPQSRHHGLWFQLPNSTTVSIHGPQTLLFASVETPFRDCVLQRHSKAKLFCVFAPVISQDMDILIPLLRSVHLSY